MGDRCEHWSQKTWRPVVAWICLVALFFHFLFQPAVLLLMAWLGVPVPPLPSLDVVSLLTVTIPLVGYGVARTYEKHKGLR